jgi:hypothetical protein
MINIIVFSKNRRMQLDAYLRSLELHNKDLEWYKTAKKYILSPDDDLDIKESGFEVIDDNNNFDGQLRSLIAQMSDDDYILFGVDDFIWFRPFLNEKYLEYLNIHQSIAGYSLRLGTNIYGYSNNWNHSPIKEFTSIDWRGKYGDFGYPFDCSQSIYSIKFIKNLLNEVQNLLRLPNDLESFGVTSVYKNCNRFPVLMFNNGDCCGACADLNRTQEIYENPTNGTKDTTVEKLSQLYDDGYRININNYINMSPRKCFIGIDNFELI